MRPRITHFGSATVLIELDGLRIVTDPVFDAAGTTYALGRATLSKALTYANLDGAMGRPEDIGVVDLVLLSHAHHKDNLDRSGLELVRRADRVVTTASGQAHLARKGVERVVGLAPWSNHRIRGGELPITITAVPARHGPLGTNWLAGEVIGFVLESPLLENGPLYITGDTLWFSGIDAVATRFPNVGTVLAHVGGARFGRGAMRTWLRFSMNGRETHRLATRFQSATIIPVHYQGWSHFSECRADVELAFAGTTEEARLRWLPLGLSAPLEVSRHEPVKL